MIQPPPVLYFNVRMDAVNVSLLSGSVAGYRRQLWSILGKRERFSDVLSVRRSAHECLTGLVVEYLVILPHFPCNAK